MIKQPYQQCKNLNIWKQFDEIQYRSPLCFQTMPVWKSVLNKDLGHIPCDLTVLVRPLSFTHRYSGLLWLLFIALLSRVNFHLSRYATCPLLLGVLMWRRTSFLNNSIAWNGGFKSLKLLEETE